MKEEMKARSEISLRYGSNSRMEISFCINIFISRKF